MSTYLEHANMSVPDVDEAIHFLMTVAPEFKVRKDVSTEGEDPPRWVHIGTDESYIALQGVDPRHRPANQNKYVNFGVNHLALVVPNLDEVVARLVSKGYQPGVAGEDRPFRKRAYFFDRSGFEWELIEYRSDNPDERNTYD